jgi:DNA-binding transcriptional MocR family regulator
VFLQQGNFDSHLLWLRERNKRRRALALEAIQRSFPPSAHAEDPCGGFVLWVTLPAGLDLARVREKGRHAGVVFAAGDVFSAASPESDAPKFIRINCAKASEPDLKQGVELLGQVICEELG